MRSHYDLPFIFRNGIDGSVQRHRPYFPDIIGNTVLFVVAVAIGEAYAAGRIQGAQRS